MEPEDNAEVFSISSMSEKETNDGKGVISKHRRKIQNRELRIQNIKTKF